MTEWTQDNRTITRKVKDHLNRNKLTYATAAVAITMLAVQQLTFERSQKYLTMVSLDLGDNLANANPAPVS